MTAATDPQRAFLRHTLATLACRGAKDACGAPRELRATFQAGESSRTPAEIVAHMADLFDWAAWPRGNRSGTLPPPVSWDAEVHRFFTALERCQFLFARSSERLPSISLES